MAKQLNLTSTKILEFNAHRVNGDADLAVKYAIYDNQDELVTFDYLRGKYSDLPAAVKTAANTFFRAISKVINNQSVNENTETWIDI